MAKRPKYVVSKPNRHGRERFYFLHGKRSCRVKDDIIDGAMFYAAYARWLGGDDNPFGESRRSPRSHVPEPIAPSGIPPADRRQWPEGTVGWLVLQHIATPKFQQAANKRSVENALRRVIAFPLRKDQPSGKAVGDLPIREFTTTVVQKIMERVATPQPSSIVDRKNKRFVIDPNTGKKVLAKVIDERTGQPVVVMKQARSQANKVKKWLSGVFETGKRLRVCDINYAREAQRIEVRGGFKMWTDEMWDRMTAKFPLGTKARLVFDLAGFTGQRRGDVTFLGIDTRTEHTACKFMPPEPGLPYGSLRVEQEKGEDDEGQPYVAHVPIVDELQSSLEAARAAGVLGSNFFVVKDTDDMPYTKESLGNAVRDWLDLAGIPVGYSLHGLRKLCVCRLIERGCSPHEVMSVTGHQTLTEIDRYARAYFRQKAKLRVYDNWRAHATKLISEAA
jgi:integrase